MTLNYSWILVQVGDNRNMSVTTPAMCDQPQGKTKIDIISPCGKQYSSWKTTLEFDFPKLINFGMKSKKKNFQLFMCHCEQTCADTQTHGGRLPVTIKLPDQQQTRRASVWGRLCWIWKVMRDEETEREEVCVWPCKCASVSASRKSWDMQDD